MPTTEPQEIAPSQAPDGPAEPLEKIDPIPVRAYFERSTADAQWGQSVWKLQSVEPGEPGEPLEIVLFKDEAQGYYLNVTTAEPSIFVMWRGDDVQVTPIAVTLSYDEAGRWMDGGEQVDRVPMPEEMIAWLTEYVRLHYKPEAARKRRGAKPSFMKREEFEKMAREETKLHSASNGQRPTGTDTDSMGKP